MPRSLFLDPTSALRAGQLGEAMQVADFGAGAGFFTRAAARIVGDGGVVWAVDINGELLNRLKNLALAEGLTNVEVARGNFELDGGSNLPSAHFDFVIVSNVLFSAHDRVAVAQEVRRVLKPGGRALVIDWRDSFDGMGPHPDHVLGIGAGRDAFEAAGLEYLGETNVGYFHWGFTVRKKGK